MEAMMLKYPKIGQKIFRQWNTRNLTQCRRVSNSWRTFIENQRYTWIREIKKDLTYYNDLIMNLKA